MPRKTKTSKVVVTQQPTQNDIAQIIYSSLDMFVSELMTGILEKNDDLKFDTNSLKTIQTIAQGVQSSMKNKAVDQLLKYY
jgi:hypothetical protein